MNKEIIEKFIEIVDKFTHYLDLQLKVQAALYDELCRKAERIKGLEADKARSWKKEIPVGTNHRGGEVAVKKSL